MKFEIPSRFGYRVHTSITNLNTRTPVAQVAITRMFDACSSRLHIACNRTRVRSDARMNVRYAL